MEEMTTKVVTSTKEESKVDFPVEEVEEDVETEEDHKITQPKSSCRNFTKKKKQV